MLPEKPGTSEGLRDTRGRGPSAWPPHLLPLAPFPGPCSRPLRSCVRPLPAPEPGSLFPRVPLSTDTTLSLMSLHPGHLVWDVGGDPGPHSCSQGHSAPFPHFCPQPSCFSAPEMSPVPRPRVPGRPRPCLLPAGPVPVCSWGTHSLSWDQALHEGAQRARRVSEGVSGWMSEWTPPATTRHRTAAAQSEPGRMGRAVPATGHRPRSGTQGLARAL